MRRDFICWGARPPFHPISPLSPADDGRGGGRKCQNQHSEREALQMEDEGEEKDQSSRATSHAADDGPKEFGIGVCVVRS